MQGDKMDIEAKLINWININMDYPAYSEVPAKRPKRFFTVERVGGSRSQFVDSATIAVQCWADTRAGACELAYCFDDRIDLLQYEDFIYKVSRNSLANFSAPDSERYQVLIDIKTKIERK